MPLVQDQSFANRTTMVRLYLTLLYLSLSILLRSVAAQLRSNKTVGVTSVFVRKGRSNQSSDFEFLFRCGETNQIARIIQTTVNN